LQPGQGIVEVAEEPGNLIGKDFESAVVEAGAAIGESGTVIVEYVTTYGVVRFGKLEANSGVHKG
jgi:hypothetical protein